MKIGDEDCEFDVEYSAEEVEDVIVDWPPRFYSSEYYDPDTNTMLPGATEELKKEYAAYAWHMLELHAKGIYI